MLNQFIISLVIILYGFNVFATEAEKGDKVPQNGEQNIPSSQTKEEPTRKPLPEILKELALRSEEAELPDFQKIDALNDNHYCFMETSWLTLGRAKADQTVTLEIFARENPDQGIKRDWLAGESLMAWPIDVLPVKDGAVYLVIIDDDPHNLTLHQVANDPRITNDPDELKKCRRQFQIMDKNAKNH